MNTATEEQRELLSNEQEGRIFYPKLFPDHEKVAVFWNNVFQGSGLWSISLKDSVQTLLCSTKTSNINRILGSSADNQWIYASEGQNILKIHITSSPIDTIAVIPLEDYFWIDMSSNRKTFVCSVHESQSDLWLVENFDPETK